MLKHGLDRKYFEGYEGNSDGKVSVAEFKRIIYFKGWTYIRRKDKPCRN